MVKGTRHGAEVEGQGGMAAERQAAFLSVHLLAGVCARPAPPLTQVLL